MTQVRVDNRIAIGRVWYGRCTMRDKVMRRLSPLIAIVALAIATPAFADAHSEMALALAAQIDAHPGRAILPTTAHPQTAAATTVHGSAASAAAGDRGNSQSNASATGLAHQAQSASASAAGQAQAAAAKSRPHPPHPTH